MTATIPDELKVDSLRAGTVANPPQVTGGAGAISTTNKANGSIHMRTDADTTPEVMHNGSAEKLGFAQHSIECRMSDLTANATTTYQTHAPRRMKVTGARRRYTVVPSSAGGTVVVGITGAGNALLASASENEEGLTNDTLAAHNLTGTAADLILEIGDKIIISVVSDNGDMAGGTDPMYHIDYETD